MERLNAWIGAEPDRERRYVERRTWAQEQAATFRARRVAAAQSVAAQSDTVRPWVLADHLDRTLESRGGGVITVEQFALSLDSVGTVGSNSRNLYVQAAGASEGMPLVPLLVPNWPHQIDRLLAWWEMVHFVTLTLVYGRRRITTSRSLCHSQQWCLRYCRQLFPPRRGQYGAHR